MKARTANGREANLWSARIWRFPILIFATAFVLRLVILYMRLPLGSIPYSYHFETYSDFYVYYVSWWNSIQSGLVPYRDFFYQYPPLFLYGLYPLYRFGGAFGAALGIILADSGSAVLIYHIAKQSTTKKTALIAGLGYAVSPFAVLYEGYVLFSLQPMLFFFLLSIFLIRSDRLFLSASFMAVAVLFKQEALFGIPAWLIYTLTVRRFNFKKVGKAVVLFASILLIVSLPFLLLSPVQYIDTMAYHPPSYTDTASTTIGSASNQTQASNQMQTCFYVQRTSGLVANCVQSDTTSHTLVMPLQDQILNVIFSWGLLPMSLLPIPFLFILRRRTSFLCLSAAYSFALLVTVFAYFFSYVPLTDVARYAYLPVYALLLVSGVSLRVPAVALCAATISLILPPGVIQLILPFLAIWTVAVAEGLGRKETEGATGQSAVGLKGSYSVSTRYEERESRSSLHSVEHHGRPKEGFAS